MFWTIRKDGDAIAGHPQIDIASALAVLLEGALVSGPQAREAFGPPGTPLDRRGFAELARSEFDRVINDPACSTWLKQILAKGAGRDPTDVLNDLETARRLFTLREITARLQP